ncbi:MAG: hypothetical protein KJ578_10045 [Bacteroidetes bacterium]|nr:hypothetical protein [Bacteroidota bacterium]MBU1580212.1 hypothetical protein [Bacteroidota bacterium]MBU2465377.1 hypothetical protein [Bacteroidota bacterium]MBU2558105.1 hypothetical protein [Bacteroidota bacterium]
MEKKDLIETASLLTKPSDEASADYVSKGNKMVNMLNEKLSQRSDINHLIGERNLDMMFDNHQNHLRFMSSMFKDYNPVVFAETVLWVFRAYRSHGFKQTYWPAQLNNWVEIMKTELKPASFDEVYPFYHWMIVNTPHFSVMSD